MKKPSQRLDLSASGGPLGPQWPVTVLPNGGGKQWLKQGIDDLLAIDPAQLTRVIHRRVYNATLTGEVYHDAAGARAAMERWAYPRTWLDFETIAFTVPRWVGTHPSRQIPFQFSAHIEHVNGHIDHREFLSLDGTDPRRHCAEALVDTIPSTGAVIAYGASFEKSQIVELASVFPDLKGALRAIADRVVDLLPVTRANWYHRDQRGSWSIKAVLPTVAAGLDYGGLEVKDGRSAQKAYIEAIAADTGEPRRQAIDAALRAYCGRDTEAMIVLASALRGSSQ
jgi:Domain of unknown function(DUF2779)